MSDINFSKTTIWVVVVFIPVVSFAMYAYEFFFKEDPQVHVAITESAGEEARAAYLEAKKLQEKGKLFDAYQKYTIIVEVYKNEEIAAEAEERLEELQKPLIDEIQEWQNKGNKRKLKQHADIIEKLLGEQETLTKLEQIRREAMDIQQQQGPQAAISFYESQLSGAPKKLARTLKKELAALYFDVGMDKYRQFENFIDSISPQEKAGIAKFFEKSIELHPRSLKAMKAKKILKKLE